MKKSLVLLAIFLLTIPSSYAQVKQELKFNTNETFDLPEIGALIIQYKEKVKVQFVAPQNVRLAAYKNIDLRKDDIVMMVNGKTVNKASDLQDAYNKLKIGGDFKLGIKRDKQMFNLVVKKANPRDLPQRKTAPADDKNMNNKVLIDGYGILIEDINGKPMIGKLLRQDKEEVKKAGLKGGDLVTHLNGQNIKTFSQFKQDYDNIKIGEYVNLRFGTKSIIIKKSKEEEMQMIRKNKHK
jgi:S1-C subfamily serine protease